MLNTIFKQNTYFTIFVLAISISSCGKKNYDNTPGNYYSPNDYLPNPNNNSNLKYLLNQIILDIKNIQQNNQKIINNLQKNKDKLTEAEKIITDSIIQDLKLVDNMVFRKAKIDAEFVSAQLFKNKEDLNQKLLISSLTRLKALLSESVLTSTFNLNQQKLNMLINYSTYKEVQLLQEALQTIPPVIVNNTEDAIEILEENDDF